MYLKDSVALTLGFSFAWVVFELQISSLYEWNLKLNFGVKWFKEVQSSDVSPAASKLRIIFSNVFEND